MTLPAYRPRPGRYDELADEQGRPRDPWPRLVEVFERLGPHEVDQRRRAADRLLRTEGASYVVHDGGTDDSRPWGVDPVPMVWPQRDWAALEAGLAQRARLFDALLADVYGPQRLLREGTVPAEAVLASPSFSWAAVGTRPAAGPRLTVYAADIVRDAAGRLLVLRDHTDAPGGAGYALVNRRVLSRLFPDVHRQLRVERLAPWFHDLRQALAGLAPPDRSSPRAVVLTPGVGHPSYFEHTYLASYLGYHLVEGEDLAVRGGRVWLRALANLEPVDVILRRVEDGVADPLLRGPAGAGGVPGLLEAARAGGVGVANAFGSAVAADLAVQAYLPAACESLLGESLRLHAPETWWLGDVDHRGGAAAAIDDGVLHELGPDGVRSTFATSLTDGERADWDSSVQRNPQRHVVQPRLELATAPVFDGQAVVPGTVVVRVMAVANEQGWKLLPGGLGRVVRPDEPALAQRDGRAKDVWVLADHDGRSRRWQPPIVGVPQVDLRTSLPARAAEALFWVGRNAERAETTARFALGLVQRSEQAPELTEAAGQAWLVRAVSGLRAVSGGGSSTEGDELAVADSLEVVQEELAGALGDRPGGMADSLTHLARSAGSVREFLSTGTWRVIGGLDARRRQLADDATSADPFALPELLHEVVLSLMALAGLASESIVRGPSWRFLDLGRRLERALLQLGAIEAVLVPSTPAGAVQAVYETLLAANESLVAYRRRYRSDLELDALCDLLLGDDGNPRALAFQIDRITEDLASLPEHREVRHQRELVEQASRRVLAAGWLEGRARADGPHLALAQVVLDVRGLLLELVESLVGAWFAHAGQAHAVRAAP